MNRWLIRGMIVAGLLVWAGCGDTNEDESDVGMDVVEDTTSDTTADTTTDTTVDTTVDTPPDCEDGETRLHACPDDTMVPWCVCVEGAWDCIDNPEEACRDTRCDDGSALTCDMTLPMCDTFETLAIQDGCWVCVNAATCRPWGEPGCEGDATCPADAYCDFCATSSCPACDDCVAACLPHDCPTEPEPLCDMIRPECAEGVAVVRNGCWVCVDRATCEETSNGAECRETGGYCASAMAPCAEGYVGGEPMDCAMGRSPQCCFEVDATCSDGSAWLCDALPTPCASREVLALQNGCWACVNPATCLPWGEPQCRTDADCDTNTRCDMCGTSSCPACEDCVAACLPHRCPTEPEPACDMARPTCGDNGVAVVRNGCWVCVDLNTCEEPDEGAECRAAGGYCDHYMTPCRDGYTGHTPSDCPLGRSGKCCLPRDNACDDGDPILCDMIPPVCGLHEILAAQDGCWSGGNPATCLPWGEPECRADAECSFDERCDPCGSSSCPACDDCVAACIPHDCPTEEVLECRCARPDCGEGNTTVIADGCWVCVDAQSCAAVDRGVCE